MSLIKQTFKKVKSKTSEELYHDLIISSKKVASAPTPAVIIEVEHYEKILSIGDFNATKKSVSNVSTKRGSYSNYSDKNKTGLKWKNIVVKGCYGVTFKQI